MPALHWLAQDPGLPKRVAPPGGPSVRAEETGGCGWAPSLVCLDAYAADYAHLFDQPDSCSRVRHDSLCDGRGNTFLAPAYFISSGSYLLGVLSSSPAFNLLLEICSVLGDQEARAGPSCARHTLGYLSHKRHRQIVLRWFGSLSGPATAYSQTATGGGVPARHRCLTCPIIKPESAGGAVEADPGFYRRVSPRVHAGVRRCAR